MADLFTKADVAQYLNQTLSPEQESLLDDQIIPGISQYARNFCNRSFDATGNQTETFDGGEKIFFIKEPPINAIVSVTIDGDLLDADQYFNYQQFVEMLNVPAHGNLNVVIVYTSNNAITDDLKFILVKWAGQTLEKSGVTSGATEEEIKRFTAGSVTIEYRGDDDSSTLAQGIYIPTYAYDVLKRYRLEPK